MAEQADDEHVRDFFTSSDVAGFLATVAPILHKMRSQIIEGKKGDGVTDQEIYEATAGVTGLHGFMRAGISNARELDANCQTSILFFGDQFTGLLKHVAKSSHVDDEVFDKLSALAFCFLIEYEVAGETGVGIGRMLGQLQDYVAANLEQFGMETRKIYTFAIYRLPFEIFRRQFKNPKMQDSLSLGQKIDKADQIQQGWNRSLTESAKKWDAELDRREAQYKLLVDERRKDQFEYRLAELRTGFSDMRDKKKKELVSARSIMVALGVLTLIPASLEFYLVVMLASETAVLELLVYSAPAIFAAQLLAIYFFRLAIGNVQGLKAQVLQLDLREALCKFVQPYSDFSERSKRSENPALEKFESLIFSGIVESGEKIPSTFDGLDQLGKLLNSARATK